MKISKMISLFSATVIMTAAMAVPVSAERDPFTNEYFRVEQKEKSGFSLSGDILTKTDENGTYGFTGKVKINGSSKFYDNGVQWTGWRKVKGKWYYFDPDNNGIMAEGKVKTALGYYYFDKNGAWNGKLSKSAKCPEDLEFMMSESCGMSDIEGYTIDTASDLLKVPGVYSDDDTRSVKLSKRDMQIFYDVIMSCKLTESKSDLTGYGIIKTMPPEGEYYMSDDTPVYSASFTVSGKSFEIKGDYDMFQFCGKNEDVRNFAYFRAFADRYIQALPEYSELMAIHEAAIAEYNARYSDNENY